MGKFCQTHAPTRTTQELEARQAELEVRPSLGPGLKKELARIKAILVDRAYYRKE